MKDKTDLKELFFKEIQILSQLKYPTILCFLGVTLNPFSIITEFLPNETVQYQINQAYKGNRSDKFDTTHKFIIILGIALALRYLQSINIAHRDIKPSNILLDSNFYPKVCDFGLSKKIATSNAKTASNSTCYNGIFWNDNVFNSL